MKTAKKPLALMCAQPAIPYYAWQVEVMLQNFKDVGIHEKYEIRILFAYNINETAIVKSNIEAVKKVENKFKDIAQFYYYQDTRNYPISYISSIRPNILKQHFAAEYLNIPEAVFYHDCDIVFTKFPDFFDGLLDGKDWYVSDTRSYIGHKYILSKGEDVLNEMCSIVNIDPKEVERREDQSGGAQYLMKNVDFFFFQDMEVHCERLFKEISDLNRKKKAADPSHHEVQIWCADMWAILWGAWKRGFDTKIIPELDFCWATDRLENWEKKYIFHNAGIVDSSKNEYFYKGDFRHKYPFLHECESYRKDFASYKYFEIIKSVGANSCLL